MKTLKLVISVFCINGIQDPRSNTFNRNINVSAEDLSSLLFLEFSPPFCGTNLQHTHTRSMYLKFILQYVGYENKLLSTEYESRNETFACIYKKGLPFTVQSTLWIFN